MKNLKILLVYIFVAMLIIRSHAFSAETIAVIIKAKGEVTLTKAGQEKSSDARRGQRLEDGDKLVTGKESFAALRFIDDASLVRVSPHTVCTINGKRENNQIMKNLYVEVGTIFSQITQQKGAFQVATPTSVASVKGTRFITDQKANPGTFYYGEEGEVEITNEGGTVTLTAGFTAFVASQTTIPVLTKTQPGDLPQWEGDADIEDEFELGFENDVGQAKTLKFRVKKKE